MKTICPKCGVEFENNTKRRFCSRKCANSHKQTDEQNYHRMLKKRKYLNPQTEEYKELLKNLLKNKEKLPFFKTCSRCGKEFMSYNYERKNCDDCKCNKNMNYTIKNPSKMGGLREKGGKTKEYINYTNRLKESMLLNKDEVKVAKYLDRLELNWHRNWNGFDYIDLNGKNRKFYPDFYIDDFDLYVEYKGWIDSKISHKMKNSLQLNNFKLKIIYSNDKRYKKLGLNLEQIENCYDNLLLENICTKDTYFE